MNKALVIITMLFALTPGLAQTNKPIFSSNTELKFPDFLKGVRYAEISLSITNQDKVDKQIEITPLYYVAQKYLGQLGFEYVALTSAEKIEMEVSVESYCQFTSVLFGGDIGKNYIQNMTLSFVSCNGDLFSFQSTQKFKYNRFADVEKKLIEDWKSLVKEKPKYNSINQLVLPSNPTTWSRQKAARYLEGNEALNPMEGIYERVRLSFEDIAGGKYHVAVIKDEKTKGYRIIYLSGATNFQDWKEGELKARLIRTATPGFYSVDWITRDKSLYEDVYCQIDELGFRIFSTGTISLNSQFIKVLPIKD